MTTATQTFPTFTEDYATPAVASRLETLREQCGTLISAKPDFTAEEKSILEYWLDEGKAGRFFQPLPFKGEGGLDKFENSLVVRSLDCFRGEVSNDLWVTAWESLESLQTATEAFSFGQSLQSSIESIAKSIAGEMFALRLEEGTEEIPEKILHQKLQNFMQDWRDSFGQTSVIEMQIGFVQLFFRHLAGPLEAPLDYWQILLARFHLYGSNLIPVGKFFPWDAAIQALEEKVELVITASSYYSIAGDETFGPVSPWVSWLPTLAVVRGSSGPLSRDFLRFLNKDFFPPETDDFLLPRAAWKSDLRQKLERSALDPLEEQCNWILAGHENSRKVGDYIKSQKNQFSRLGEDLAQGMKGSQAASEIARSISHLCDRSLWFSVAASSPAVAKEVFLRELVETLGVDPKDEIWKKHSQIAALLKNVLNQHNPGLESSGALLLLQAFDQRVNEIRSLDWEVLEEMPILENLLERMRNPLCKRDARYTLRRLWVEARLRGSGNAISGILKWYARAVFPHLRTEPPADLARFLVEIAERSAMEESIPLPASRLLNQFAGRFPELTAAAKLLRDNETIGQKVADFVFTTLPDYAEKVGEEGKVSCVRDNCLTLKKIAAFLMAGIDDPAEKLQEWWNGVVGSYLANRPKGLFEANLQAIFQALSEHLNNRELPLAFGPLEEVYRETLGVECLAAKASLPADLEGTLWKGALGRRHASYRELFVPTELEEARQKTAMAGSGDTINAEASQTLYDTLFVYLENLASHGDEEAAAKRIFSRLIPAIEQFGAARVGQFYRTSGSLWLEQEGLFVLPVPEAIRALNTHIGRLGLALKFRQHSLRIAREFVTSLDELMPGSYGDRDKCVRDQSLFLERLAQMLLAEPPSNFWLSAMRYLYEILLPHISYPAEVWRLSMQTLSRVLGDSLDFLEFRQMTKFIAQWDSMIDKLSHCGPISKKFFMLGDYTFSANREEEELLRALTSTCLTVSLCETNSPLQPDFLIRRFVLSLRLPYDEIRDKLQKGIEKIKALPVDSLPGSVIDQLDKVKEAAEEAIATAEAPDEVSPQFASFRLLSFPRFSESIWKSLAFASHTMPETSALYSRECDLLAEIGKKVPDSEKMAAGFNAWNSWMQTLAEVAQNERSALREILVCHLLYPIDGESRSLSSSFPNEVVDRVGLVLLQDPIDHLSETIRNHAAQLIEVTGETNRLRSDLRLTEALGEKIQAGLYLWSQRETLLESDHSSSLSTSLGHIAHHLLAPSIPLTPYGMGMRQEAFTGMQPLKVSDEAAQLWKVMTGDGVVANPFLTEGYLASQINLIPAQGKSWNALLLGHQSSRSEWVGDFFGKIGELAEKASSYALANDSSEAKKLEKVLLFHLDALTCTLREAGDLESSLERLKLLLIQDLDTIHHEILISGYFGLQRFLPEVLPATTVPFWEMTLELAIQSIREAAAGRWMALNTQEVSQYVATRLPLPGQKPLNPEKCARDQMILANLLAYSWQTHAGHRQVLQIGRFLSQTTLPYLKDSPHILTRIFSLYEEILLEKTDLQIMPAVWDWTSYWQLHLPALLPLSQFLREAAAIKRPESKTLLPNYQREDDLLQALAVAATVPQSPDRSPEGLIARLLLSSARLTDSQDYLEQSLKNTFQSWEDTGLAIPVALRRGFDLWVNRRQRAEHFLLKPGQNLIRMTGLMGSSALGKSYWEMSLRAREENGRIVTDPADLIFSREEAEDLPTPTQTRKLTQTLEWIRDSWASLKLTMPEQPKTGFLKKMFGKSDDQVTVDPELLRGEAQFIANRLTLHQLRGQPVGETVRTVFFCPQTQRNISGKTKASTFAFYQRLSEILAEEIGEPHPLTLLMKEYAKELQDGFLAFSLLQEDRKKTPSAHLLALIIWQWKELPAMIAYGERENQDPLIILSQHQKEFNLAANEIFSEAEKELCQKHWAHLAKGGVA